MTKTKTPTRPRLLIEEWLPAQAIGVECMREENNPIAKPPHCFFHVWWARRPLVVSRAAVLGSVLPSNFERSCFERLLGFYGSSSQIVTTANLLEANRGGGWLEGGHGKRAFANHIREADMQKAHEAMRCIWEDIPTVIDPMAGGGSIPLESARMGLNTLANEYNPVAGSILEATVDYPLRFGPELGEEARSWGKILEQRANARLRPFYSYSGHIPPRDYIFARTVPCPDTGHPTPLVPDWSLLRPRDGKHLVAEPVLLNKKSGEWTIRVREVGKGAGKLSQPPLPTYGGGSGISLFTGNPIPADYIKAMAQQGKMGSTLYAVVTKATSKLEFRHPEAADLKALAAAAKELARLRPKWEKDGIIPTENIPQGDKTKEPLNIGHTTWASLFSDRQLLALGVLVEELHRLNAEIVKIKGKEIGEAVVHLLAFVVDKLVNNNCIMSKWECTTGVVKGKFDRHDFAFKATWAELALSVAGSGFEWALGNVLKAYRQLAELPHAKSTKFVQVSLGSVTNLSQLENGSVTAVVVDPPYADNVQYSELADFFYVWLKRTQGHRRPEWFASNLCDHDQEAVVNISRHRNSGKQEAGEARKKANEFYQKLMTDTFKEAKRILRDDGVLTVMFTHKKQEAWAALFDSLIATGFTITATWPVQTESQHSLHQAQKNAAQSTVLLVARKREPGAGRHHFDDAMKAEIRDVAQKAAARLRAEGLNPVDQLVGAFGPAMEVFSRYDEVKTDTGDKVSVADAIQIAADAVADWRVEQLAKRGLGGVDADSRFVLLCWDVLGAAEFRFNEAKLLGNAVGMGVDRLKETGLVVSSGDKVKMLSAKERRREKPVRTQEDQLELLALPKKGRSKVSRKVHPGDEFFVSAIDMCHALALRYAENGGGSAGVGAARGMALQQGWKADAPCAKLMDALVQAAPPAVRFPGKGKKKTAADEFPEFRAWHEMLKPLFGITPPEWKEPVVPQSELALSDQQDEIDAGANDGNEA